MDIVVGIVAFALIFAALGVYLWRHRKDAKALGKMSKLDAAVKAEAERIRKQIP